MATHPKPTRAMFPGTFDPATNGHMDLIRRGAALFDELVVAVGENPGKTPLLGAADRAAILADATAGLDNVRVQRYTGLTVAFAAEVGATVLLRGLRSAADMQHELPVAHTNRAVAGVETLFLLPSPEVAFISSGLIRQIAAGGGDVTDLVPPAAVPALRKASRG